MKLTKSKLKQLIAEELALEREEEAAPEGEAPTESTVQQIIKLIAPKIKDVDKPKEYAQLVRAILGHDHKSLDKKMALTLAFGGNSGLAGNILKVLSQIKK